MMSRKQYEMLVREEKEEACFGRHTKSDQSRKKLKVDLVALFFLSLAVPVALHSVIFVISWDSVPVSASWRSNSCGRQTDMFFSSDAHQ